MKHINFIDAASPRQERSLAQWYTFSCAAIILTITILSTLQFYTWYRYRQLCIQHQYDHAIMALQDEYTHLSSLQQTALSPTTPMQRLLAIQDTLAQNAHLQEYTQYADHLTFIISTKERAAITRFKEQLSRHPFFASLRIQHINTQSSPDQKMMYTVTFYA